MKTFLLSLVLAVPAVWSASISTICAVNQAVTFPLPSTATVVCPGVSAPVGDFFQTAILVFEGSWSDTASASRIVSFMVTEQSLDLAMPPLTASSFGLTSGSTGQHSIITATQPITNISGYIVTVDVSVQSPDPAQAQFSLTAIYETAVPEPATYALTAAALLLLTLQARSRTQSEQRRN